MNERKENAKFIYCILRRIKDRTKQEEKIFKRLQRNLPICAKEIEEAEEYCNRQGWIESVHHVDELGYTTRYYHTIEVTASGREQVPIMWASSNYNKWNWEGVTIPFAITVILFSIYVYLLIKTFAHVQF